MYQMFTHPEAHSLPPRGKKGGHQLLIPLCLAEERSLSCLLHSVEHCSLAGATGKQPCSPTLSRSVHPRARVLCAQQTHLLQAPGQRVGHTDQWPLQGSDQERKMKPENLPACV